MDQGIMVNLKHRYKRSFMLRLVDSEDEDGSISITKSINKTVLYSTWEDISPLSLQRAWHKTNIFEQLRGSGTAMARG